MAASTKPKRAPAKRTRKKVEKTVLVVGSDHRKVKRSFTIDYRVDEEARERIGARGLSAFVNDSLKRSLQHLRIQEWLDEQEVIHGPIPKEAFARVDKALKKAGL